MWQDGAGESLLAWYDKMHRCFPWRAESGAIPEPYHVWLSEVMLQQTTVKTVIPYFIYFSKTWSSVNDLACADLDDVLTAWAGLGYYARGRNLHACARIIRDVFNGVFPDQEEVLRSLPGIGSYTAAAILAIAYDHQILPVDGNIERITARYHAIEKNVFLARNEIQAIVQTLLPSPRSGDLAQALMDLGAMICTPRNPSCHLCPIQSGCAGFERGIAASLPIRPQKKSLPVRYASIFWLESEDGSVLLRSRPPSGLLGGMKEFPSGPWVEQSTISTGDDSTGIGGAPTPAQWRLLSGHVKHIFTHFKFVAEVWRADIDAKTREELGISGIDGQFVHRENLEKEALPSVMRKVIAHVLNSEKD